MKSRILNKDFQHPSDGWYNIEALGNHPNHAAGVVQVIDPTAAQAIVTAFNSDSQAGRLRHGNEMLIDHEHFSDQPDQETRAYGWLQELQNRDDGIYGRIRWTATGKTAVDGGDYRFFSTEYDPQDLEVVKNDGKVRRVRPLRLSGLTLTNMNNNRGQKPITNRSEIVIPAKKMPDDGKCPDCGVKLQPDEDDGTGVKVCPQCSTHFTGATAPADNNTKTKNRNMKDIAKLLGLSEDAAPEAVSAEITKLKNRATELDATNQTLLSEQVDGILAEHGIKEEPVKNRLKPVLTTLKNRADRVAFLTDCGFKPSVPSVASVASAPAVRILNRGSVPTTTAETPADEAAITEKIKNRAQELKGAAPTRTFDSCWQQAQREVTAKK